MISGNPKLTPLLCQIQTAIEIGRQLKFSGHFVLPYNPGLA